MSDIDRIDWKNIERDLNSQGFTKIARVLLPNECKDLRENYHAEHLYRKTIHLARYRFGQGDYRYFHYPLPPLVSELRKHFYPALAPIANQWMKKLNQPEIFPATHEEFLSICKQHQQLRPTPLILRYQASGYNTLHQDLYGKIYFPFQVVVALTQYGEHFGGGELVLVEQVPRAQSKATVITPSIGDAIIFTTNFRPATSARGYYQARIKHGISQVTWGERFALGVIFHDAE